MWNFLIQTYSKTWIRKLNKLFVSLKKKLLWELFMQSHNSFFIYLFLFYICLQAFSRFSAFPLHLQIITAKVTIGCQISVNRLAKLQCPDNCSRTQIEFLPYDFCDFFIRKNSGSKGIRKDADRLCHTDGIGKLYFTFASRPAATIFLAT